MAARLMRVTFHKLGRGCGWTAVRPNHRPIDGPVMAAGGDLPHDLYTFVIEDALAAQFGFWGCVAHGATFRTLDRKVTPQGREVIRAHLDELEATEHRVNEVYFAWRAGTPTPHDAALDDMLARWRAVPDGGDLTADWRLDRPEWRERRRR